jgi:hypothetical protein
MKKFVIPTLALGLCLAIAPTADASTVKQYKQGNVWVRTVIHDDGCMTVSKKDITKQEVLKETKTPQGVLISSSRFEINDKGDYIRGQILDRGGNLAFVSQFIYDQFDRILEERISDARGVPVRRIIYRYDTLATKKGKAIARPFTIDFRNGQAVGGPTAVQNAEDYSTSNDRGFRVDSDGSQQQQAKEEPEEKERFRLFKKRDSDSSDGERRGLFGRRKK